MKFSKKISTIDTHTQGAPTRILVDGVPRLKADTMMGRKLELEEKYPWLRTMAIHEPRGHCDCFGAVLTPPIDNSADAGVIFMDPVGYLNMCGHGIIGVSTALVETGRIPMLEPYTDVTLETPSGLVSAHVKIEDFRVKEVTFEGVPSFLYASDIELTHPEIGAVRADIAFGGSFFLIVKAKDLGLKLDHSELRKIQKRSLELLDIANNTVKIKHPLLDIDTIDLIELYEAPHTKGADVRNCVVLGVGQTDRSPCGTGTCAKLATLYAKGLIDIGQPFYHESINDNCFRGEILSEAKIGGYSGIIPQITGAANIVGFYDMVVDEEDPLTYGFVM